MRTRRSCTPATATARPVVTSSSTASRAQRLAAHSDGSPGADDSRGCAADHAGAMPDKAQVRGFLTDMVIAIAVETVLAKVAQRLKYGSPCPDCGAKGARHLP